MKTTTLERDTRSTILATGQKLMSHKGFSAVGLTEVLSEAGVPKGSFYHYFASKDAFGEAMMKSYFDDYFTTMDAIVADTGKSSAQHLMQYWQNFYDIQVKDDCQGGCLVVKLGAEIADLSEAM